MGLIDNFRDLFTRESISSNIGSTNMTRSRISLKARHDRIPYDVGQKIMRDVQVSTGYDLLKYILSSKEWVLIANDNDIDNTVYDFILNMLLNLDTELTEIIKQQTTAVPWGFCIHELLFDVNEDGKLYLKGTVPLHIKTLQHDPFTYDDDGNLISIHQEYKDEYVDIPINKVMKYSFNANFDEDYGRGLLLDFRPIVEDKFNINDWLMTFLERHESPTLYGKVGNSSGRKKLLRAFEDVSNGTGGLVVGHEDEVGVLESSHRGETFFKTLHYKDNEIFRRYGFGNLLLGDSSQTGTYAQSMTQLEFGQIIFDGHLEERANCIQKQIINPIVEWNFGDVDLAPTISFDKFTTGDLEALFNIIKPLIDSGVVDSENKAVQDSIALAFKKETGLQYTNETMDITEDFDLSPVDGEKLTENMLSDLDGIR